jgi:hypothetical protein
MKIFFAAGTVVEDDQTGRQWSVTTVAASQQVYEVFVLP